MAEITQINPQTDTLTLADTIESIISGLTKNQKVTIAGLGTFYVIAKDERPGRNPRTGEQTTFRASRRPKIEFDKDFVEKIDLPKATTPAPTPAPTPSPAAIPSPVPALASVSAPAAPVLAPAAPLPPPIPAELIAAAAAGSESKWQIKAPSGGFVEISTSQFAEWGVGEMTPVYSVATGWRLAGQVPELLGFIVK